MDTHLLSSCSCFPPAGSFFFLFFVFANKVFKPYFEWQPVLEAMFSSCCAEFQPSPAALQVHGTFPLLHPEILMEP